MLARSDLRAATSPETSCSRIRAFSSEVGTGSHEENASKRGK
jgi:hypothetical protein